MIEIDSQAQTILINFAIGFLLGVLFRQMFIWRAEAVAEEDQYAYDALSQVIFQDLKTTTHTPAHSERIEQLELAVADLRLQIEALAIRSHIHDHP